MLFFKKDKIEALDVTKAYEILEKKDPSYVFLDVRNPNEWETGTIPSSIKISLSELENSTAKLDKSKNIIVLCQSGGRSSRACEFLKKEGFNIYNLSGGMISWKQKNYPVEK